MSAKSKPERLIDLRVGREKSSSEPTSSPQTIDPTLGDRIMAMMHQIQDLQAEVRNLKGEGPRTEQAGMVSRGFAR
jgi:hypothetical protein